MIRISISRLRATRSAEFVDKAISMGNVEGEIITWTDDAYLELNRPIQVNARWPIWARALRQFSTPEDKGIGDVVLRIIGDENSEAFKAWHMKIFGKPCNCNGRLKRWNALYPLL